MWVQRRHWTSEEISQLRLGVKRLGGGRWKDILLQFDFHDRTAVDLKVGRQRKWA